MGSGSGKFRDSGFSAADEAVPVGGFDDAPGCGHGGQPLVKGGGADSTKSSEVGEWLRLAGLGKDGGNSVIDRSMLGRRHSDVTPLGDFEGQSGGSFGEFQDDAGHGRCRSMLDRQGDEVLAVAAEVEV